MGSKKSGLGEDILEKADQRAIAPEVGLAVTSDSRAKSASGQEDGDLPPPPQIPALRDLPTRATSIDNGCSLLVSGHDSSLKPQPPSLFDIDDDDEDDASLFFRGGLKSRASSKASNSSSLPEVKDARTKSSASVILAETATSSMAGRPQPPPLFFDDDDDDLDWLQ